MRLEVATYTMKSRLGFNFYDIFFMTFCLLFGIVCFYPMWYVFLGSINPSDSFGTQNLNILPPLNPSFKYYKVILTGTLFQRALIISVLKTVLASTGTVILTGMMAYGVSKKHVKGMKFVNFYMVFTIFFSGGLIPTFLLIRGLGLYDTFWVMVIPSLVNAGNFILMRNYFAYAVPAELEDAAVVDGVNEVIMFFKIIIPISMPLFASIFLFTAVGQWNDWYTYLIYVNKIELQPFIVVLQKLLIDPTGYLVQQGTSSLLGLHLTSTTLKMTTIMVAIIPIIILYPFLQKHFAKGMMIGAVKG